jgi:hypothetical protein
MPQTDGQRRGIVTPGIRTLPSGPEDADGYFFALDSFRVTAARISALNAFSFTFSPS